jgi:DNA helicase-2/ATP-dependent DNA helicase PcrA
MDGLNILTSLNEMQQQAVTAPVGHLAVIAGAGSGKTRVLVHRIAWLQQVQGVSAHQILAVTFTNKAAAEMRDRVEQLLGYSVRGMWLGTFHGIAHRFLRAHWQQAKLPESFQILDADDQLRLIRRAHNTLNLDEAKWPPRQSQWFINSKKDEGLRSHQIKPLTHHNEIVLQVYQSYEELCERSGLVDFAELLLRMHDVLAQDPALLAHYQQRFAHILVDEFQDTNAIQYAWLKQLAGNSAKIMVVGDDDQSIYSWRGARIENIHRFRRDFSNVTQVFLEQNYRSTKTILAAANAVITNNKNRISNKNLWTTGQEGEAISIYAALNETDEARFICNRAKAWQRQGHNLRDIAVLYRSNAQSRALEEELINANLPYCIYGGLKFFERAEIKDALAYLRLLVNQQDDSAFERIVNTPTRGIGHTTLIALREHARQSNISLWQASNSLIDHQALSQRALKALANFLQLIQQLQQDTQDLQLHQQTEHIIQCTGLFAHYSKDKSDKTQSRIENLQELVHATRQFNYDSSIGLAPLQAFLSYTALESGDTQADYYEDCVQLMTLHAAKGLEFQLVFLSGMEEGLFPHKMSLKEGSGSLEEERRLCYVGMTRARQKLYLSYAELRRLHGGSNVCYRSRFIREIPSELLDEICLRTQISQPIAFTATKSDVTLPGSDFQLGQRVFHPTYGEGVILNYEGQGPQARLQIKFHSSGAKWIVADYVKLQTA